MTDEKADRLHKCDPVHRSSCSFEKELPGQAAGYRAALLCGSGLYFQLVGFLKRRRVNLILELRIDFKLAQFCHRQTILSEIEFVFLRRSLCMVFLPLSSGVFRLALARSLPGIPCRRSCDFQGSMKACRKHITIKQVFLGRIRSGSVNGSE